jgi:hypothetical protein
MLDLGVELGFSLEGVSLLCKEQTPYSNLKVGHWYTLKQLDNKRGYKVLDTKKHHIMNIFRVSEFNILFYTPSESRKFKIGLLLD